MLVIVMFLWCMSPSFSHKAPAKYCWECRWAELRCLWSTKNHVSDRFCTQHHLYWLGPPKERVSSLQHRIGTGDKTPVNRTFWWVAVVISIVDFALDIEESVRFGGSNRYHAAWFPVRAIDGDIMGSGKGTVYSRWSPKEIQSQSNGNAFVFPFQWCYGGHFNHNHIWFSHIFSWGQLWDTFSLGFRRMQQRVVLSHTACAPIMAGALVHGMGQGKAIETPIETVYFLLPFKHW